jgi:hypothetical protein
MLDGSVCLIEALYAVGWLSWIPCAWAKATKATLGVRARLLTYGLLALTAFSVGLSAFFLFIFSPI